MFLNFYLFYENEWYQCSIKICLVDKLREYDEFCVLDFTFLSYLIVWQYGADISNFNSFWKTMKTKKNYWDEQIHPMDVDNQIK